MMCVTEEIIPQNNIKAVFKNLGGILIVEKDASKGDKWFNFLSSLPGNHVSLTKSLFNGYVNLAVEHPYRWVVCDGVFLDPAQGMEKLESKLSLG